MKLAALIVFLLLGGGAMAATAPIASGENKEGTVAAATSDTWTISVAIGETLLFRVGELSGGNAFSPYLALNGPNGALIREDWSATDARVAHRATVAGTYTVVVRGLNPTDAGTYRLCAYKIPGGFVVPNGDEGGALTNGQNHTGTITVGDMDAWTVSAAVGETLLFRVGELSGGNAFSPYLALYGPDGAFIREDWAATDARIAHRATTAGTYTLVVVGLNDGDAGTYRLSSYKVTGSFVVPSGDEGGELSNGQNHVGAISLGDMDAWTVNANVGDTLLFRAGETSGGNAFSPYIALYGPDGALIKEDWSADDARIAHRATLAGVHTVVVVGLNDGDVGSYRLSSYKVPGSFVVPNGDEGGALTNGQNHTGSIAVGDMDAWTVTASVGETLLFRAGELSGGNTFSPYIVLYGPDGALIQEDWSATDARIAHRATSTGTHTLVVVGLNDGDAGTYRLCSYKIPGNFVVPAGDDGGEVFSGQNQAGTIVIGDMDAWTVNAAANDLLQFRVTETSGGNAFSPYISLFGPTGASIAENWNATEARIEYRAPSTGLYTLVVVGLNDGDAGSYQLSLTGASAAIGPTIVAQPSSQNVAPGGSFTLTVNAAGTAPLSYQWRRDETPIAGATGANFSVNNAQPVNAGNYTVVVSNSIGSVTSNPAMITIGSAPVPPTILNHPTAQNVSVGADVIFAVSAEGTAPLSYQWRKDQVNLPGATAASLVLSGVTLANGGSYSVVVSNSAGSVTSNGAALTVIPVIASRISNVSVRTTLKANQTLIVGMSMSGGGKPVLVRGVGPGLAAFGVSGTMPDPRLALFEGSTMIEANDNWGGTAALSTMFASVGAFALPPASLDAALSRTVDGGRTAQISGTAGGTVLVEAYDAGTGNSPRLVNISARNFAGTGEDILIAGFTIAGTAPKTVLIRAIGPTLAAFGVSETLADPKLEVYSSATKINENDTWAPGLAPTFASVGAFALTNGSKDAALVVSLPPGGGYTVQVSGADGGTGEVLVEIYEVQP